MKDPIPTSTENIETPVPESQPNEAAPAQPATDQLPEWVQKELSQARTEAARYRTERNSEREGKSTLENQIKAINKALGLESEGPDIDGLQKTLADRENELRTLKVESAFAKAAKAHDADEELTLAVLTRKGLISSLDPSSEDFTKQLDAAVKAEVENNPKLKATQVAAKSGATGFNGNGGRSTEPVDLGSALQKLYS